MPWHRPLLVRAQLGRPQCGGSPASRGLAGLGVTGLSAARLRAGTTVDAFSAVLAFASRGAQRVLVKCGALTARDSRWAAPDQPTRPLARSRPAGGAHRRPALPDASMRTRTRAPGGAGHSSITVRVTMSFQVTAFGLCTSMIRSLHLASARA